MIGKVIKVWIGFAQDRQVRQNAASGGIITGSLLGLMEQGFIDGAVVTKSDFPHGGISYFAQNKDDILQSAGSIYSITNLKQGLDLAQKASTKKVAVVGLPCQIAALESKESFYVTFGLMCGHNMLPSATLQALKASNINIEDVKDIQYRGIGWFPGKLCILMKNGSIKNISYDGSAFQKIWESKNFQTSKCLKCTDFAAEKADVACCDAWLEEYRGNMKGFSIVLAHTQRGTSVIQHLIDTNILNLFEVDESVIYRANMNQIRYKKEKSL